MSLRIKKMRFIIIFLIVTLNSFAQNPISVHDLENEYNSDWWEVGAVLVDTFQVNPFTGVVYLHNVFESLGEKRKHEYIAFIDHYENGFKDGLSLSFNTSGEIIQIANYSRGERLGLIYYTDYKRMVSDYKENMGRMMEFWDKYESDNDKILEFERRTNSKGKVIYLKYFDKNGKEISKEEHKKITNYRY